MTTPEPQALWRCGSCENRRGALILLLHGRGVDERDLFALAPLFPPEATVAALRGPIPAAGGYTWYDAPAPGRPTAGSLAASVRYVERWLDERAGDAEEIWLAGFSAGAALAGALLAHAPQRFAGAALLHGSLPFDAGVSLVPGRFDGIPLFYGYGLVDDVIPPDLIARTRAYLGAASGASVDEHAYDAAHGLGDDELRDLAAWFRTRLAAPPSAA